MTEQDAIDVLVTLKGTGVINQTEREAIDVIEKCMLELEQYRALRGEMARRMPCEKE